MEPNGQNDGSNKESEIQDNNVYKSTTILHEYIKKKGINKYKNELQHLIPIRNHQRNEKEMPIDNAGCFSYVYFSWMTPLVWRSFRKGLKPSDTYQCSNLDSSRVNGARLENIWEEESRNVGLHNTSLQRVLYRFVRMRVLIASLFYLICLITGYLSSTYFLKKMLDHIENESETASIGIKWSIVLFISELCRASCFAIMYAISIRTSIRASSGLNSILYNKLLTSRAFTNKTVGEMVNLFANDTSKIFNMIYIIPLSIGGPIVILVTIVYTWYLLGVFSLVGVLIFILIFGLQFLTAKIQGHYRKKLMNKTDERVSIMTELLTYIKLIKLYAWERPFSELIFEHRENERKLLEKCQYLQCFSTSMALLTPMITTIASILAYTLAKQGNLTAAKAFTLVMVNYIAAHGIRALPLYIRDIVNGRIALSRIERVLQYDDKDNYLILTSNPLNSIELKNATLAWDSYSSATKKLDKPNGERPLSIVSDEQKAKSGENAPQRSNTLSATCLFDLNLEITNGMCIGIIGSVGSGKTALLRSLLGQLRLVNGKVAVRGLSAYVSQEPWILNATVRDNITFGHSFDKKRYYESVNCCGLTNDISSLPASDLTEVGERGVTLSGGQKQRIALARAYYSDRDIYLLDDPLSSVDRNVGNHIFNHCIRGGLKGKTIFLVTHQIEYLEAMDIVLLMRDGRIVNQGTHTQLYDSDQEYKQLVELSKFDFEHKNLQNLDKSEVVTGLDDVRFSSPDWGDVQPLSLSKNSSEASLPEKLDSDFRKLSDHSSIYLSSGRLINEEHIEKGNISADTYKCYIDAGGGALIIGFVICWVAFLAISSSFANWWLGYWISQGNGTVEDTGSDGMHGHDIILDNPDLSYFQTIYGLSVLVVLTTSLALGYMFTKITITASNVLHNQVFIKIFQSPMSFFDTVPIGRILNIFTRDMDEIDTQVPSTLDGFLQRLMIVVCNLLIILIIFPWFLLPFVGIALLFWLVYNMFRGAMRNLKRIENSSRSPIYSHVAATIEGLSIIKAFNKQNDFIYKFSELIDFQSSPNFLYYCSMRWLSTRMDILCVFISFFACILSIIHKESVGAAFAGLALVLSMQLSGLFQFVIRLGVDAETKFTSVERIHMYIQQLNDEANAKDIKQESLVDWPTRGRISFRDVTMRYRLGLPLALKNITFDISPQEKIGIVGRTGSGKSSITTALFRLVEISSGTIHIDGVNIESVPLYDLRSRISIIPQDPILFRGSIRKNLDPFNQYKIQEIMDCLECVRMKFKVNNLKQGINTLVNENSATFSAGERQLLCMARALLKKSKILILDEATSSMDGETEKTIHDTIFEVFKECTVLNIAHRLQSIIDCDRIMVMHDGNIVEFDKPSILLSNPLSLFKQMISTQIDSLIVDNQ